MESCLLQKMNRIEWRCETIWFYCGKCNKIKLAILSVYTACCNQGQRVYKLLLLLLFECQLSEFDYLKNDIWIVFEL